MKITLAIVLAATLAATPALAHDHVGVHVMPFSLERSIHVFDPLPDGGTQDVLSRDGDASQITLIRAHLRKEARAFSRGDYSDPAAIHGADMPGLAELRAGAGRMRVEFEKLPRGGRIRFRTRDPGLIRALRLWFAAQVHAHGGDATMAGHGHRRR